MLVLPGPETAVTPRKYLEILYAESDTVVPDWLLRKRPQNTHEWGIFGRFLPALALPLYQHLMQSRPDRLIACARTGIPLGTTVQAISHALKIPVPAVDQQVHYRKISMSPSDEIQLNHLKPMLLQAQANVAPDEPRITVMDGVTVFGNTYRRTRDICEELGGICLDWVALTSHTSRYISGTPNISWPNNNRSAAMVPWEDDSGILGVKYTDQLDVIQLTDTTRCEAFCKAQFAGAKALAGVLSAEDMAYLTAREVV